MSPNAMSGFRFAPLLENKEVNAHAPLFRRFSMIWNPQRGTLILPNADVLLELAVPE
jgi:hypothetical protein